MDFGPIDIIAETYLATISLKSRWIEDSVIEEYDAKKMWNPKLYVENAMKLTKNKYKEAIKYKVFPLDGGKTEILEERELTAFFWERLELYDFPFDMQELGVTVCTQLDGSQITIVQDDEFISSVHPRAILTFHEQQKYDIYNIVRVNTKASYDTTEEKEEKVTLNASAVMSRKSGLFFVNSVFINGIILMMVLSTFTEDPESINDRLSAVFKLLLTVFLFIIANSKSLPSISYLTLLDKYNMLNITFITLVSFWFVFIGLVDVEEKTRWDLDTIAFFVLASIVVLMKLFVVAIFIYFRRKIKVLQVEEKIYTSKNSKVPYLHLYKY